MAEHHDSEDHEHEHSLRPHVLTLLALFALTFITWVAALVHLGPLADLVALAIAFVKASLVIMIFMHVKEGTRLIKVTAFAGFFTVFLFFAYLIGDVMTRDQATVYKGWQPDVRKPVPAEAGAHHGDEKGHGGGAGHSGGH